MRRLPAASAKAGPGRHEHPPSSHVCNSPLAQIKLRFSQYERCAIHDHSRENARSRAFGAASRLADSSIGANILFRYVFLFIPHARQSA